MQNQKEHFLTRQEFGYRFLEHVFSKFEEKELELLRQFREVALFNLEFESYDVWHYQKGINGIIVSLANDLNIFFHDDDSGNFRQTDPIISF